MPVIFIIFIESVSYARKPHPQVFLSQSLDIIANVGGGKISLVISGEKKG